jgi:CheY-like chemotaxis protein
MFARALKAFGEVETAANGMEAMQQLANRKFAVVLLDLHMPVVDGFMLLHSLANKAGPNRDTPIYVVTADNSEQARLRALKHRALFLLTKPVPLALLVGLVKQTLRKAGELPPESVRRPSTPPKKPGP